MNQHHDNYKLNKDKNPSGPLKDEAGMKIRDYYPKTPPSPVIIPSLHLYTSHNWLAKEIQSNSSVCPLLLREYSCSKSLYFLNFSACLLILLQ